MTLCVPVIPAGADNLTAALAYADAGWYVLPVKCLTGNRGKNPGSVVGDHWQRKSSHDPKVITAWFAGTDHGIALHCGRSGAVGFDVDKPDKIPPLLGPHLKRAPYQSSRQETPTRGHYLFAVPEGRRFGNSGGRLGSDWGEVRGANGVVIAAPSVHSEGGRYRWERTGPLPVLPDEIAELLGDTSPAEDAATDAVVEAFIAEHQASTRPELIRGWVAVLRKRFDAGVSRHQAAVTVVAGACKEARAGYFPAGDALLELRKMFIAAVTKPPVSDKQGAARSEPEAASEWRGIVAWAVGQALAADLDEVRARVNENMPDDSAWARCANETADTFWASREILTHIKEYAVARRVSPWAVLGAALVHAAARIPPHVVLPPLTGSYASLNLFVALVGASGAGKDAAEAVARDAIYYFDSLPVVPLGSGEGIAATYRPNGTKTEQPNAETAAIFTAPEIDTWAAIAARQGSTLTAELRKLWMGQTIGQGNAGKDTRRVVAAHSYRACGIFGVQPLRAGPLLTAADGGMPQRMVFLPAVDPDAPDRLPPAPKPRKAKEPDWRGRSDMANYGGLVVLDIPECARREIDAHRLAVLRGDPAVDPLDGHALLTTLKVAAALMALDGRSAVNADDWTLAADVMTLSGRARKHCAQTLLAKSRRDNWARGQAADERDESAADRKLRRCQQTVLRAMDKMPQDGYLARSELRRRVKADLRPYFDTAVAELTDEGRITEITLDRGTGYTPGTRVHPGTPQPTCGDMGCTNGVPVHPWSENNEHHDSTASKQTTRK